VAENAEWDDWQLLAQIGQVFRTITDTFTDAVDMHRGQAILLCTLARQDGMTQSEIAEQLSVQGSTITNMLQKMEEVGLVRRLRDADDNRLVRVYMTDEGRQKEQAINVQFAHMQEIIFKDISEQERLILRRLLFQILNNMSETC